uniref:Uncharacterized protein n=1 Tax=Parascaris univalens TaxID=6257 RepID=A0A915B3Z1_PARUN
SHNLFIFPSWEKKFIKIKEKESKSLKRLNEINSFYLNNTKKLSDVHVTREIIYLEVESKYATLIFDAVIITSIARGSCQKLTAELHHITIRLISNSMRDST